MDIKVQRGVSFIPKNETTLVVELEEAVNPKRAFIVPCGSIYGNVSYSHYSYYWDARLVLKDSKHIEIKRVYPSMYEAEVAWQVIEVIPTRKQRYGVTK